MLFLVVISIFKKVFLGCFWVFWGVCSCFVVLFGAFWWFVGLFSKLLLSSLKLDICYLSQDCIAFRDLVPTQRAHVVGMICQEYKVYICLHSQEQAVEADLLRANLEISFLGEVKLRRERVTVKCIQHESFWCLSTSFVSRKLKGLDERFFSFRFLMTYMSEDPKAFQKVRLLGYCLVSSPKNALFGWFPPAAAWAESNSKPIQLLPAKLLGSFLVTQL